MFWSTNAPNAALPPSSSIKEANEHMQAMLKRIWDLEQRVKEQTELMNRRDLENTARFQNFERQKELEMAAVQQDMLKMKERNRQLEGLLKERDVQIAYLFHRCSYLDEAASYVPLLDQLSQCLKSSLAAPPPKVQTVKPTRVPSAASSNNEYTPDVPAAPSNEKVSPATTLPSSHAASTLADHFARPKQQQQLKPTPQQPFIPQYPEPIGSIYATSPNVALNGGKK